MPDESHLDSKYFVDQTVYNCPFCNRRHVTYEVVDRSTFNWDTAKSSYAYIVKCNSCEMKSMHLSFESIAKYDHRGYSFNKGIDIDAHIFYSQPTSFFTIDERVPRVIRDLVTEADGCAKMNFLTGASACARKAIYEMTVLEKCEGDDYESRIKFLKVKYPQVDPDLFDILAHIQAVTSDKVHEMSWSKWNSPHLRLIIETLKAVLYEIYVLPKEKSERSKRIGELRQQITQNVKTKRSPTQS